jgi:hypothetical protein
MSDSGKGSSPRPFSVSQETYANNFDRIFRKDPRIIEDQKAEDEAFEQIKKLQEIRQKALDKMVHINQELGLYEDSPNRNTSNF